MSDVQGDETQKQIMKQLIKGDDSPALTDAGEIENLRCKGAQNLKVIKQLYKNIGVR